MQCPKCGTENPADYSYCLHCGERLPAPPPPADAYVNPRLERQRKKDASQRKLHTALLIKFYTRTATKMMQPTIHRFNKKDAGLTPEAVAGQIETPVLERMAARRFDQGLFLVLWLIFAGAVLLVGTGIGIWLFAMSWFWEDGDGWMLVVPALAVAAACVIPAYLCGVAIQKKLIPIISAELARRGAAH